jgi:hypothetical protein
MNNDLKKKVLEMKDKLKRGDMARIVERTEKFGVQKYDVYNIMNAKSLADHQKLIIVLREAKRCIDNNERELKEFERQIENEF